MNNLLKLLSWREVAYRILDSRNPKPVKAIVIADAIGAFDGYLPLKNSVRHHAFEFVREAERQIEHGLSATENSDIAKWLENWCENYLCMN